MSEISGTIPADPAKETMRCLELYSGIGGFAVAAQRLGWSVQSSIDINQHAAVSQVPVVEHCLRSLAV